MTPGRALSIAGVPENLHAEAVASIEMAKYHTAGLLMHKIKARYFKAGKIADSLAWEDDRLIDVHPAWADTDIAPVINVTANGDNGPWHQTPEGGRPDAHYWTDTDPASAEFGEAVAANYWKPGTHPRSRAARKAWYRRNAGEYLAWSRGAPIDPTEGFEIWRGTSGKTRSIAWHCCGAWLVKTSTPLAGRVCVNTRTGYEIDNIFSGDYSPQMWWPIAGKDLRAPVTHSTLIGRAFDMRAKPWEAPTTTGPHMTKTHWTP